MAEFTSPVDIANRALQRVGASRINSLLDASKQASEVNFNYGKLRRAELQRSVWRFATRRAAIRPIDTNSMMMNPTLWDGAVTYFFGSIVQDQAGTIWKSAQRDNLGNQPGLTNPAAWVPYFGPLTASPYSSQNTPTAQTGYFTGELVYTYAGDGTFNVYTAITPNSIHPALPNNWDANATYATDNVVVTWPTWSSGTTYAAGQTVTGPDGNIYSSLTNGNLNNNPTLSVNLGVNWAFMPTLFVSPQGILTDLSGTILTDSHGLILVSQLLPGTLTPIDEWNILNAYSIGQFVIFNASIYVSLSSNNTGNNPGSSGSWANCSTSGTYYQSKVDLNRGNTPASSPNQWTTSFSYGHGSPLWMQIGSGSTGGFPNGVGLSAMYISYPVGTGPLSQSWTKNVYRLPAGFLRRCSQDPKAGVTSWLGSPSNLQETDWTLENDLLVTWDTRAIILRFIADMQDVTKFPDMFCEALSCRIALEVCEPLTQSTAKLQFIAQEYKKFLGEAITIDAIDVGAEEPPLDDLILCRA